MSHRCCFGCFSCDAAAGGLHSLPSRSLTPLAFPCLRSVKWRSPALRSWCGMGTPKRSSSVSRTFLRASTRRATSRKTPSSAPACWATRRSTTASPSSRWNPPTSAQLRTSSGWVGPYSSFISSHSPLLFCFLISPHIFSFKFTDLSS